jgi:hypothetical protein
MAGQLGVQEEIPAASGLVIVSLDLRRLPLPCGQWLPLALRLEALPLSVGSFFPCCCWSGDMVFSLRDGRASASRRSKNHSSIRVDCDSSRRNLTNNFVACREEPCTRLPRGVLLNSFLLSSCPPILLYSFPYSLTTFALLILGLVRIDSRIVSSGTESRFKTVRTSPPR